MSQSGPCGSTLVPVSGRKQRSLPSDNQVECRRDSKWSGNDALAICLQTVTIRGVIPCCNHIFCFSCIVEWSKVTNSCPLCKRVFHEVKRCNVMRIEAFKDRSMGRCSYLEGCRPFFPLQTINWRMKFSYRNLFIRIGLP